VMGVSKWICARVMEEIVGVELHRIGSQL
jgi:hypothetical protein